MLTRADIDDILKLIDGSDFLELKLEMGDLKLELRRPGAAPAHAAPVAAAPTSKTPAWSPASASPVAAIPDDGTTAIPAPMIGTFWHAARPGDAPFVSIGSTVTPDSIIGIIEVMKLMNSVTAGVAGVVTGIDAPNGRPVQYGDTLIRVQLA
jgi:acetyl-CoA carboxylase biotin carboxyl carrier protein